MTDIVNGALLLLFISVTQHGEGFIFLYHRFILFRFK